jgi:hypothetical protein
MRGFRGPNLNPPEEPEYPCECCGEVADNCLCPVCPVCQQQGDLTCYSRVSGHHGGWNRLTLSVPQVEGMLRLAKDEVEAREQGRLEAEAMAAQFQAEEEYWQEEGRRVAMHPESVEGCGFCSGHCDCDLC